MEHQEKKKDRCPNCKIAFSSIVSYSLFISLFEWPTILLFSGIVILVGESMLLGPSETLSFAMLVTLPLLFRFERKKICGACGLEVRMNDSLKVGEEGPDSLV